MRNLIKNDYLIVEYFDDKKLLTTFWTHKTSKISDSEIKETIKQATDAVLKYKPKFMISDDRQRKFLYSVDVQNWVATKIYKALNKAGVTKYALLLPEDKISKISTEQTVDEVSNLTKYEVKYFSKKEDALLWYEE